jgi:hypothetical protein
MDRAAMLSGGKVVYECSPVGESQSNGDIENATQRIQRLYRTQRSALGTKYGQRILAERAVLVWMVRFVSGVMFAYDVGTDGYQRIKRIAHQQNPGYRGVHLVQEAAVERTM